jgi:hypothetical protein
MVRPFFLPVQPRSLPQTSAMDGPRARIAILCSGRFAGLAVSVFRMTTAKVSQGQLRISCFRYNFGTTEREKNGTLFPKRHQTKHLEFVLS